MLLKISNLLVALEQKRWLISPSLDYIYQLSNLFSRWKVKESDLKQRKKPYLVFELFAKEVMGLWGLPVQCWIVLRTAAFNEVNKNIWNLDMFWYVGREGIFVWTNCNSEIFLSIHVVILLIS